MANKLVKFLVGMLLVLCFTTGIHSDAKANSSYSQYVLSLNPVAYWRFNTPTTGAGTNVVDISTGNPTGTLNSGTFLQYAGGAVTLGTDYQIGIAGPIAGDNSYGWTNLGTSAELSLSSSFAASNTTWSVAFWYNTTTTPQAGCFFTWGIRSLCMAGASGASGTYFTYLNDYIAWFNSSSSVTADGNWHFVVLNVTSSTTVDIWQDGTKVVSALAITGGTQGGAGSNYSNVGNRTGANSPFIGSLSEVAYFNYNLSSTQIQNMYAYAPQYSSSVSPTSYSPAFTNYTLSPNGLGPALIGYFRLNDTSGTTIRDYASFGFNGTITGTSGTDYSEGQFGALTFDPDYSIKLFGTGSSGVTLPTIAQLPSTYSISFWFKGTTTPQNAIFVEYQGTMIGIGGAGGTSGPYLTFVREAIAYYTDGVYKVPMDGQWHFLVANFGTSTVDAYVDNVHVVTALSMSTTLNSGASLSALGYRISASCCNVAAYEDEVAIYNRNLLTNEIAKLYAYGTMGHKPKPTNTIAIASFDSYNSTTPGNMASVSNGVGSCTSSYCGETSTGVSGNRAFWVHSPNVPTSYGTGGIIFVGSGTANGAMLCMSSTGMYFGFVNASCGASSSTVNWTNTQGTVTKVFVYGTMVGTTATATVYQDITGVPGPFIGTLSYNNASFSSSNTTQIFGLYPASYNQLGGDYTTGNGFPSYFWNYGSTTPPLNPPGGFLPTQVTTDLFPLTTTDLNNAACATSTVSWTSPGLVSLTSGCSAFGNSFTNTYQGRAFVARIGSNSTAITTILPSLMIAMTSSSNYAQGAVNASGNVCTGTTGSPTCSTAALATSPTGFYDIFGYGLPLSTTNWTRGFQVCPELTVGAPNYAGCVSATTVTNATPDAGTFSSVTAEGIAVNVSATTSLGGAYPYVQYRDYGSNSLVPTTLSQFLRGF